MEVQNIQVRLDKEWSFDNITRQESLYATHGYHKYPAKFIPQIVSKLINDYSDQGETILDPFGGCGTTLVESRLSGRNSIGVDVSGVAVLISKAKINEIDSNLLEENNRLLIDKISKIKVKRNYYKKANLRLKYWFKKGQYNKLMEIYKIVEKESDSRIKLFYRCCFSNILKNCSIWYAKSIKPMRDLSKKQSNPVDAFSRHLAFMTAKNREYENLLNSREIEDNHCRMLKGDSRNLSLQDGSVDLIITSPPYVTSYEYADLHQLSTLWFDFADNINEIKKNFVGTATRKRLKKEIDSITATNTIEMLKKKDKHLSRNISNYYSDLSKCYNEMFRVLRNDKYACVIIGNTEYLSVPIKNMQVSAELLIKSGFEIEDIIKRKLSSKIFTPYRDKAGKFTDADHCNKRRIYQYEYIIVAKKPTITGEN